MSVADEPAGSNALHGWQLFTLRPAGEARALLAALRRCGAIALNLPLLRLRGEPMARVRAALDAAADAGIWVFSSPAAVRQFVRVASALRPGWLAPDGPLATLARAGRVFAPGPGTARTLIGYGVEPVQAPSERYDSEGLLALPGLAAPLRGTAVVVGAPDGRGLIEASLRQRGAVVVPVHVYRREPAPLSSAQRAALAQARRPMLVASSDALLARLPDVLPETLLRRLQAKAPIVVASTRLAERAATLGFGRCFVARSAQPEHLVHAAITAADASSMQRFG